MRNLIIHPTDGSTDFLKIVYRNVPNQTLITGGIGREELNELIKSHDRVMMMGHGCPSGLFCVGQFDKSMRGLAIDHSTAELLNEKDNNVFIWCNADMYVNPRKLKGFYTGMFISELGEAYYCGVTGSSDEDVSKSNYDFVEILSECINKDQTEMYNEVTEKYGALAKKNKVAKYNHKRLYLSV